MSDGRVLAVGIILYPGFDTLDVMGPIELLSVPVVKDKFRLVLMSWDGQPVTSAAGVRVVPDHCSADHPALDVLLVPGKPCGSFIQASALFQSLTSSLSSGVLSCAFHPILVTGKRCWTRRSRF